jgi:predicted nucleic acid-binding protein
VIYFDTSYLAKCYLAETGGGAVRALAAEQTSIACCEYGRLELVCSFHRNFREAFLTRRQHQLVLRQLESDDVSGVWMWLPITADLLRKTAANVRRLGAAVFIRAGDAIHLTCAAENGLAEIYSNDHHLLAAAPEFGLRARNVIAQPR